MPRKKTKKTKLSPAEKKDRIRLRDRARKARKREDPEVRGKENAQQRARREDPDRKALIDAKRHEAKSRRKLNEKKRATVLIADSLRQARAWTRIEVTRDTATPGHADYSGLP
ncbi:hypothetical protein THAOC_12493 [Thalassiosira oceanica]|uniref:Guanine nucleotide-binding protein-like 3 N-terminal domain-containing protein n=1 Tax=Thalassiosira oceanica TaxID=159749 RepID=K0SJX0_THAOC|nr:hypothetical protein THAOC_12493 [Thalassiosira oceanica]|eukprot:EJK66583.1 hypothetical protein THAOC_12493 [Thalassiosira oceanica]